jgi:hypothetical protein
MDGGDRRTKDEWLGWVSNQPDAAWGPPEGKTTALLQSGFQGRNAEYASQDSAHGPKYTIEQTEAGKQLHSAQLHNTSNSSLSRDEADAVWGAASAKFAQNINGPVETHIVSSDKNRIARGTELPGVFENGKISSINGIPRDELASMPRTEQYYATCRSEVTRAQEYAASGGDGDRAQTKEVGLNAMFGRDHAAAAQQAAMPAPSDGFGTALGAPQDKPLSIGPRQNDNTSMSSKPGEIPSPNESVPRAGSMRPANDNSPPGPDL